MAISYKDLGLVNTRAMFAKAVNGGYAIPAYNFNNMEQLQAIIQACVETESPLILQVSKGAREYANQTLLRYMAQGATEYAKEIQKDGKLIIEAFKEDFEENGQKAQYTSGSITTFGHHSWKYGRIEVRAKLPKGVGTWPAIWMLGVEMRIKIES